jgi:gliding motility-associated transport system permease protein/gliding motility-associatede transport system auxiliary component
MLPETLRVARKELSAFFSSPVAYIFLGSFLLVSLFVFFWADAFFARNIADVRPLFEWMPVLLIFLVAALTMRMWSEERRMGTIEHLLTLPVSPLQLLTGKFLAGLVLLALALLLTLPLPLTVSFIGPLDWGPVWGGYLAALFLGAAYLAIGLYLSARSDNQIVSLISTVLVCGLFYLLGSDLLTGFFGDRTGEILKLLGSGSRFASITRGVIDLRDLYYYLSMVGVFFTLTLYSLERLRWAQDAAGPRHRLWGLLTLLLIANLLAGNLWLQKLGRARLDLTAGRIYSLSDATRQYLGELQEPLLIRGYFSAKTHPLLAPLVPRLRDLIEEYQLAGGGKVRAEFVDPQQNPELEAEANQKYNIKPVPFQVADRYQSSLVNSYFHLLVQYGDRYQILSFRDLIEVKRRGAEGIEVELRNPEYALTRAIKKVMYGFKGGGDLFAGMSQPVTLTGYISAAAKLPKFLRTFKAQLGELSGELQKQSGGKFSFKLVEPEANGGEVAKKIETDYGFRPMQAGLFDPDHFYFYLALGDGEQTVQVALPEDFTKAALRTNLTSALKRFAGNYLKTVALAVPQSSANPYLAQMGMNNGKKFQVLRQQLEANYNVRSVDLNQGRIPEGADILVVAAPKQLSDKGLFAVDQFLMQGGTVLLATSPYQVSFGRDNLSATPQQGLMLQWLAQKGLKLDRKMVLDPRNQPFPVPVSRNVGGFVLQELRLVPYPYFIDVRNSGLNSELPVSADLNRVLMDWASPIEVDTQKTKGQKLTWLLKSSPDAWTSDAGNLVPRIDEDGRSGFTPGKTRGEQLLGVALQGSFTSWFKGKTSPLLAAGKDAGKPTGGKTQTPQIAGVIDKSPDSARLILFGSSDFLSDQTLQLASSTSGQQELGALQLVENAIDWSLEDPGLLSIRSHGHYARTLKPLTREARMLCEYLDYALVLGGLLLVFIFSRLQGRRTRNRYQQLLEGRV